MKNKRILWFLLILCSAVLLPCVLTGGKLQTDQDASEEFLPHASTGEESQTDQEGPERFIPHALIRSVPSATEDPGQFVNSIGMKMVKIPRGSFLMGTDPADPESWDEEPAHRVTISEPFFISETEVTIVQFRLFRPGFTGSMTDGLYAVGISWKDAAAFCKWLSEKEGKTYRLPTEAEWEYAGRAGTGTPFWSGNEPPDPGAPNPWGLLNMHSGPLEWCEDWYGPYSFEDEPDPAGPETGILRVVRGGGLDQKTPYYARSANRASYGADFAMMQGTKARAADDVGNVSTDPVQDGLIGVWYGTTDFRNPKAVDHMMTLDVNWNGFQQPGEDRETQWSAKWEGTVTGPSDGDITFHAASDYGVKITVDGKEIIRWEGLVTKKSGTVRIKKGRGYPISIEYMHNQGKNCFLDVTWSWKGGKVHAIPASSLKHSPAQVRRSRQMVPRVYEPGHHSIGFRVVQAEWPKAKHRRTEKPFFQDCVVQEPPVKSGPDPAKPWYRRRALLPVPPTDVSWSESWAAGLPKGFWPHIHNSALQVCPNGDLLVSLYTAKLGVRGEDQPEVMLIGSRLRYGSGEWDIPEFFIHFADANTTSPCFHEENGRIFFFCGNTFYDRHYPFQWIESKDNGETWTEPRFPQVQGDIGPYTPQPINSVFRDRSGVLCVATDGYGPSSLLWATRDNGMTWMDTGGRTFGRHTTFVLLQDGRILGMGGKKSQIDGYMPKSVSNDGGKTWEVSKTPFSELGGNQRPSLIRLKSGRLFMCGDFQEKTGRYPEGIRERGSYAALSEDEGETWIIKKLEGTLSHFEDDLYETIGYSVARQAATGVIHIIATSTVPLLHFEVNEAWILDEKADWSLFTESSVPESNMVEYREFYPDGTLKTVRHGGISEQGEFMLDGSQVWYYGSGQKKWEVTYKAGRKTGQETFWDDGGRKIWERFHKADGSILWTQYWPNGKKKAESNWRDYKAEGPARRWGRDGNLVSDTEFWNGRILYRR